MPFMPLLQSATANHARPSIDLPRIATTHAVNGSAALSLTSSSNQSSQQSQSTSLPSFASFEEHASTRLDDSDEVEIAPMSSRLSCNLCTKLNPRLRDVALAVAELDENIQSTYGKPVTRVCVIAT
jgi:hypothetical protein